MLEDVLLITDKHRAAAKAIVEETGIDLRGDKISINPKMPKRWNGLSTRLHFKQTVYYIDVKGDEVKATADKEAEIVVKGKEVKI